MRLPYRIVRPLARIALKVYFKKIFLTGLEHLPKDKPIILAANHPTAFLEPCLLACLLPMPLHFMVRGDFFQKPLFRKMLESLQMIPMYRKKDIGIQGVRHNFSSLDVVYDLLNDKKTILILAEGTTVHEKRLRPIKKGAARMAIGAVEKYPDLEVHIVPIGVNYTDVLYFRSTVMLDIGPSIPVLKYVQAPNWHKAKVINQLTKEVAKRLSNQVIHISLQADDELVNQALNIARNEIKATTFPIQVADRQPLQKELELTQQINSLAALSKQTLQNQLKEYTAILHHHSLTDLAVKKHKNNAWQEKLLFLLGYPLYVIGKMVNFLPLYFGKWWSEQKVSEVEFIAPIKASFSLAAYLLYYALLMIIGLVIRQKWFWFLLFFLPISGFYTLLFYDFKHSFQQRQRWAALKDDQQARLLHLRNKILSIFHTLSKRIEKGRSCDLTPK